MHPNPRAICQRVLSGGGNGHPHARLVTISVPLRQRILLEALICKTFICRLQELARSQEFGVDIVLAYRQSATQCLRILPPERRV